MYFNDFDKILYNFFINGKEELKVITDITKNVRVRKEILSNITLFDTYIIQEGETPEIIAEKVYGRADYHWSILLANDRYDYLNDFPLRQVAMDKVVIDKYGEDHIHDIHHYEAIINGQTFVVDSTVVGSSPITNSDYELSVNESKRLIKIISPSLIIQVAQELSEL